MLVGLLLVVGLAWWFTGYEEQIDAARAFAATSSQKQCVPEALRRLESCMDMSCANAESAFLGECLGFAKVSPSLCEGVPRELVSDHTVAWAFRECRGIKAPQPYCSLVLGALLGQCAL